MLAPNVWKRMVWGGGGKTNLPESPFTVSFSTHPGKWQLTEPIPAFPQKTQQQPESTASGQWGEHHPQYKGGGAGASQELAHGSDAKFFHSH